MVGRKEVIGGGIVGVGVYSVEGRFLDVLIIGGYFILGE